MDIYVSLTKQFIRRIEQVVIETFRIYFVNLVGKPKLSFKILNK